MDNSINFFNWARRHYGHHLKRWLIEGCSKTERGIHIRSVLGNPFRKYRTWKTQAERNRKLRKIDDGFGEMFNE